MRPRKHVDWRETQRIWQAAQDETREHFQRRLQCVAWVVHSGHPTCKVAEMTGFSQGTVRNLCSRYHRGGIDAVRGKLKGGRRRQYSKPLEERKFLWDLVALAKGNYLTAKTIKSHYEKRVGRPVAASTIYRLLKRNHYPLDPNEFPGQLFWKMDGIRFSDLHPCTRPNPLAG